MTPTFSTLMILFFRARHRVVSLSSLSILSQKIPPFFLFPLSCLIPFTSPLRYVNTGTRCDKMTTHKWGLLFFSFSPPFSSWQAVNRQTVIETCNHTPNAISRGETCTSLLRGYSSKPVIWTPVLLAEQHAAAFIFWRVWSTGEPSHSLLRLIHFNYSARSWTKKAAGKTCQPCLSSSNDAHSSVHTYLWSVCFGNLFKKEGIKEALF